MTGIVSDREPARPRAEPEPLPAHVAALGTLVPRVVTLSAGLVVAFAVVRGPNGNKTWDKAMFVVAVALTALLCVDFLVRRPTRVASIVTSACAAGGLIFGIARIERPTLPGWDGFGVSIALGSVYLAAYLWRVLDRAEASRTLRAVLTTGIAVVVVNDLASLIRTLQDFSYAIVNAYVLNEMLAPAAGRVPDANFVPQYVSLYGWLLVPLRHVMSPWSLAQSAMILASVLGVLSVALGVTIAARTMSPPSLWLAAGIVVPLTCVTASHGTNPFSSIAAYLPALPVRIFPSMLLTLLGIEELARLRAGFVRDWHLPALGVLAGLIAWNSKDFGLATSTACCLVLPLALPRARRRKSLWLWACGLVAGLALYPILVGFAGAPINLAYFGLFSRAFGNGLGAARIQVPGPVVVVLPLLLASAAVGWCMLWRQRPGPDFEPEMNDRAVLTLALVGTWSIAGFLYYLNRSFAAEQMQTLLMPCGVCVVALVSLARDARARLPRADGSSDTGSRRRQLAFYPIALFASLGLLSMLQSPNPVTTTRNLANGRNSFAPTLIPMRTIHAAEAYVRSRGGSLGYFGNHGSYIHLLTGLPNPLLYDDPTQLTNSPTLHDAGCRYLDDHATTWLIISPTDDSSTGPDTCGSYHPVKVAGLPPRTLFAQNRR